MQVKTFTADNLDAVAQKVNEFLRGLPYADIVKTESFPLAVQVGVVRKDRVVMCVWLRCDAKDGRSKKET